MALLTHIKTGNERFPALTGIRAAGATVVFFCHLPFHIGFWFIIDVIPFFFVLSGFLITYIYYDKVTLSRSWLKEYFINRFARIYPVYFLLLTIAVLLQHDFNTLFLVKNYLLFHSMIYLLNDVVIQPSWTLTVEECFYILAPLFILLIRRYNFWVSFLAGVVLLGVALLVPKANVLFLNNPLFIMRTTFFGHFAEFFAGIFVALLMKKKDNSSSVVPVKGYTLTGVGTISIVLVMIVISYLHPPMPSPAPMPVVLVNNFVLPAGIAVLYMGLLNEQSIARRLLSSRLAGILGRTSYSFYLVHTLIVDHVAKPFLLPYFGAYYNLFVLFTYLLAQLVALALFIFFEEPINRIIRKKNTGGRKKVPAI